MRTATASVCGVLLLASAAAAPGEPSALKQVGALSCLASLQKSAPPADITKLVCQLRLEGPRMQARNYDGEISRSGLWLVDPGPVRLAWRVLSPAELVDETALEGSYGTASAKDFALAENNKNTLFGGAANSIALQLMAPPLDGINPSTRMILRAAPQSGDR